MVSARQNHPARIDSMTAAPFYLGRRHRLTWSPVTNEYFNAGFAGEFAGGAEILTEIPLRNAWCFGKFRGA
jgi:hypothetical protein